MIVTLAVPDGTDLPVYDEDSDKRPFLRRWHSQDTVPIEESYKVGPEEYVVDLEEGLRVKFGPGRYYKGDYWMIPVRAGVRGGVEGEQERGSVGARPATRRHLAPLRTARRRVVYCGSPRGSRLPACVQTSFAEPRRR